MALAVLVMGVAAIIVGTVLMMPKVGHHWWEGLLPGYNFYVLFCGARCQVLLALYIVNAAFVYGFFIQPEPEIQELIWWPIIFGVVMFQWLALCLAQRMHLNWFWQVLSFLVPSFAFCLIGLMPRRVDPDYYPWAVRPFVHFEHAIWEHPWEYERYGRRGKGEGSEEELGEDEPGDEYDEEAEGVGAEFEGEIPDERGAAVDGVGEGDAERDGFDEDEYVGDKSEGYPEGDPEDGYDEDNGFYDEDDLGDTGVLSAAELEERRRSYDGNAEDLSRDDAEVDDLGSDANGYEDEPLDDEPYDEDESYDEDAFSDDDEVIDDVSADGDGAADDAMNEVLKEDRFADDEGSWSADGPAADLSESREAEGPPLEWSENGNSEGEIPTEGPTMSDYESPEPTTPEPEDAASIPSGDRYDDEPAYRGEGFDPTGDEAVEEADRHGRRDFARHVDRILDEGPRLFDRSPRVSVGPRGKPDDDLSDLVEGQIEGVYAEQLGMPEVTQAVDAEEAAYLEENATYARERILEETHDEPRADGYTGRHLAAAVKHMRQDEADDPDWPEPDRRSRSAGIDDRLPKID